MHITLNPDYRIVLGRAYSHLFAAPGTQELAPHITIPRYTTERGLTGRIADTIIWATVLLRNVDTLEVYEEAIRHSEQDLEQHTTPMRTQPMTEDNSALLLPTPLNTVHAQVLQMQAGDSDSNSRNRSRLLTLPSSKGKPYTAKSP